MPSIAAIPLWWVSLGEPYCFPWYYGFSIVAGELLLAFVAGMILSILLIPARWRSGTCRQCDAPMMFTGRHFDPEGSGQPHWTDFVAFAVFVTLNAAVWLKYVVWAPKLLG